MNSYNLSFISDRDLFNHIKDTVEKYSFQMDLKKFNKNLIDPIKLTFDLKIYGKSIEEIIDSEVIRQIDKSNTNHIGYFHQNIFKYIGGENWIVPKQGFDIVNEKEKIYVEMKNKHLTMNSSSSQKTYMRMQNRLLLDPENRCFLVEVIAKESQNRVWELTLDGEKVSNERIRRVSIDKFYEIVTGKKEAFKQLLEVLPTVLDDIIKIENIKGIENSVYSELQNRFNNQNLLKSLYLLAFQKYEGFKNFEIEKEEI
jgi:hypothetical protein